MTSFAEIDEALSSVSLTQERQLLTDVFPKITVEAPGQGVPFNPDRHVKMIDRRGREWPTWVHEKRERSRLSL